MTRVGVFGWGVVAPKSPNVAAFRENLRSNDSWLTSFDGFGRSNFLAGIPQFDFEDYREWIKDRFPPRKFTQLDEKMGLPVKYALGAFIQAMMDRPQLETILRELGTHAHVYIGTGLGDLPTIHDQTLRHYHGMREWNRYWADPDRNQALRSYLEEPEAFRAEHPDLPLDPTTVPVGARTQAEDRWWAYWARHSEVLAQYLESAAEVERLEVEGPVETGKGRAIKQKRAQLAAIQKAFDAPDPPWTQISANLLWNIPNTSASQISMLGKIIGMTFAPVAACSSFGYTLKLAMNAIRLGEAKAVVIGATDPSPHPLSVGAFYDARVLSHDGGVSKPLTGLRGTHIAGGSIIWILGDHEYFTARGLKPLGLEPAGVGITADADHIITPSKEGPQLAIRNALASAGMRAEDVVAWDLHATATPGDYLEVENIRDLLPESVYITARKGIFGHGQSVGGGWELMAQYMGYEDGIIPPTPLRSEELNPQIRRLHERFVFDEAVPLPKGPVGKLSMGVGGINACVISKPWED